MSTVASSPHHVTPGCQGHWVDVRTLGETIWVCSDCRARIGHDPELLEAPPPPPPEPPAKRTGTESGPRGAFWFSLALVAYMVVITVLCVIQLVKECGVW